MWKSNLFLLIFLFACSGFLHSQTNYTRYWKEAAAYQKKDLPKSRMECYKKILRYATEEKNYVQILKAFNAISEASLSVSWKEQDSIIPRYERLKPIFIGKQRADSAEIALLYHLNLLNLVTRLYVPDYRDIQKDLSMHIEGLLQSPGAERMDVKKYQDLFYTGYFFDENRYPPGSFKELYLRLFYNFNEAKYYLTDREKISLLEQIAALQKKELKNYIKTKAVQYKIHADSDPYAALSQVRALLDSVPRTKLKAPLLKVKKNILFLCAQRTLDQREEGEKSKDSLCRFAEQYYKEAYLYAGPAVRRKMDSSVLNIYTSQVQTRPGKPVEVQIYYKNVKGFSCKIYRNDTPDTAGWTLYKENNGMSLVNYSGVLNDTTLSVQVDTCGVYKLVCYADEVAENENSSLIFYASDIAAAFRYLNGEPQLYVTDYKTGKPLDKAGVSVVKLQEDTAKNPVILFDREMQLDGYTSIPYYDNGNDVSIRIRTGHDHFYVGTKMGYKHIRPVNDESQVVSGILLYTDRNLYRPGDVVHVKGICYSYDRYKDGVIQADSAKKFKLYVSNPRGGVIDTLCCVTNDFGSFCDSIVLPLHAMTGSYMIIQGSRRYRYLESFQVTEYEKIGYQISLPPDKKCRAMGDTLSQLIQVVNYAGFSAAGDSVTVSINGNLRRIELNGEGKAVVKYVADKERLAVRVKYTNAAGQSYEKKTDYYVLNNESEVWLKYNMPPVFVPGSSSCSISAKLYYMDIRLPVEYLVFQVSDNGEIAKMPVFTGKTMDGKDIPFDILKSGKYRIYMKVFYKDECIEKQSGEVTIVRVTDKVMPAYADLLVTAVQTGRDSATVLLGTSGDTIYPLIEIFGRVNGKSCVLYKELKTLPKGLHRFHLPYLNTYPDVIVLRITALREGEVKCRDFTLQRRKGLSAILDVSLALLQDTLRPGEQAELVVSVKNKQGKGVRSEVLLSAFDKTTERFYKHNYTASIGNIFSYNTSDFTPDDVRLARMGTLRKIRKNIPDGEYRDFYQQRRLSEYWDRDFDKEEVLCEDAIPFAVGEDKRDKAFMSPEELLKITRRDFNETAFFLPLLRTDSTGIVKVKFTAPRLLGTFKVLCAAHSRKMQMGFSGLEFLTRKPLMVLPNTPRFLREGDLLHYKTEIVNLTDDTVRGKASLHLFDSGNKLYNDKYREIKDQYVDVTIPSGKRALARWTVPANDTCKVIHLLTSFVGADESETDSQYEGIPVFPDNLKLVRTLTRPLTNPGSHTIDYSSITEVKGAYNSVISFKMGAPLDMALDALPEIKKEESENSVTIINRLYANLILQSLGKKTDDAETMAGLLDKIQGLQNDNGGFSWFKGMGSSWYVTLYVVEKMASLEKEGGLPADLEEMVTESAEKALYYLESALGYEYSARKITRYNRGEYLYYLYVVSHFPDVATAGKIYPILLHWMKENSRYLSVAEKVYFCNALLNTGVSDSPELIDCIRSLQEYAVKDKDLGIYYPNAVMPFRGLMYSEIKMHAMILNLYAALYEAYGKQNSGVVKKEEIKSHITGLLQWLLLQKKNQKWSDNVATVDAVNSIYRNAVRLGWIEQGTEKSGRKKYRLVEDNGKALTVKVNEPGVFFCSVYNTFEQKSNDAVQFGNGLFIEREFYKDNCLLDSSKPIELQTGDKITVKYKINNTQIRSFVKITARRAACLSPLIEYSGYSGYYRGFGHYTERKRGETVYYFDMMPDGSFQLTEDFYVTQSGKFNASVVEIESLYSDDYRGNTSGAGIVSTTSDVIMD